MKRNKIISHNINQHLQKSTYEIHHYVGRTISPMELHHHDFYELYYLISGGVDYYIEGNIHHLKPGDIVLVNTTELHQVKINNSDETYERIVLLISKNYLMSFSTAASDITSCFESREKQSVISTDMEMRIDILNMLKKILALKDFNGMGTDILYNAYIMELMVKVNNNLKSEERVYNSDTKRSVLIDGMIGYIENNLAEDLSIDTLSEKFFLSKYHLSREFKKYTGFTIYRYIKLKRLVCAKQYILQKHSITDVYIKCGFGDYSNFFRTFKNEFGVTPKQFYKIMMNKE